MTGQFSALTSNLAFLTPSLAYDSQNVTLTMTRNGAGFGPDNGGGSTGGISIAATRNQGFTTLGLRAEAQIGAMPLFARAMLGWRHGFGELTPQARTAFSPAPPRPRSSPPGSTARHSSPRPGSIGASLPPPRSA